LHGFARTENRLLDMRSYPVPYSWRETVQTLVDNEESLKYNLIMAKVINVNLKDNE